MSAHSDLLNARLHLRSALRNRLEIEAHLLGSRRYGARLGDGLGGVRCHDLRELGELRRLRAKRANDPLNLLADADLTGHVGRVFHHLEGLVVEVVTGGVRRLNPHFPPALADALVLGGLVLAAPEPRPEVSIRRAITLAGVDEHPVMLPANLVDGVTEGREEVFVRVQNRSVHRELDDRLRLADGLDLSRVVRALKLLRRHVGRVLHDLEGLAIEVANGVVRSLNPHFAPALGDALVLACVVVAAPKLRPKLAVGEALAFRGIHEQPVVATANLVDGVAEGREEVLVRVQDRPVHRELDHCLRLADGLDLSRVIGVLELLRRDVDSDLHHLDDLTFAVEDWVVGSLDPHLASALGDALVLRGLKLAEAELRPEGPIGLGFSRRGIHEQPVVLAADLVERVAHQG